MAQERTGAVRSMRFTIAIDPVTLAGVKEAAAEVGVSASAWAALRLGEAVKAQRTIGTVMQSFGMNLAQLMLQEQEKGQGGGD